MLFLIFIVLNILNCIQHIEQVLIELEISTIEEYILLLLYDPDGRTEPKIWKITIVFFLIFTSSKKQSLIFLCEIIMSAITPDMSIFTAYKISNYD